MSIKLARVKVVKINGMEILAPRAMETPMIKSWFENHEDREANDFALLSLTARADRDEPTYAEIIEKREFEQEDLPMFL